MKTYIGIVRDHSASMNGLTKMATADYNILAEGIKSNDQNSIISVVKCGSMKPGNYSMRGDVVRDQTFVTKEMLRLLDQRDYDTRGGSTPLFDSVGDLIEQFESVPDKNDPDVAFLIMVITDGQENSSFRWNAAKLRNKIAELEKTDSWTFAFRVPVGSYKQTLIRSFGFSENNILEWELTDAGFERATEVTKQSLDTYYAARSVGVKSSKKFFVEPKIDAVKHSDLKKLVDISNEVIIAQTYEDTNVKALSEKMFGEFISGTIFYELMKPEKRINPNSLILIADKMSNNVYSGPEVRKMLGLDMTHNIPLAPKDHPNFRIFIQSKSNNRKIPKGVFVLRWKNLKYY